MEELKSIISPAQIPSNLPSSEEWNWALFERVEFSSLNNGINETLEFNIYNTNDFSFCEEDQDNQGSIPLTNNSTKIHKNNNYRSFNQAKRKGMSEKEEAMVRDLTEIKEYKEKQKDLFLGMFSKEDFELNVENRQNNSFRELYQSPLEKDNGADNDEEKERRIANEKEEDVRNDLAPKDESEAKEKEKEDNRIVFPKHEEIKISPDKADEVKADINDNKEKKEKSLACNMVLFVNKKGIEEEKVDRIVISNQKSDTFNDKKETSIDIEIDNNSLEEKMNDNDNSIIPLKEDNESSQKTKSKNDEVKPQDHYPLQIEQPKDSLQRINELTERFEKSETKYKIEQEKNSKLIEVLNIYKVLKTIEQKSQNNSGIETNVNPKVNQKTMKQSESSDKLKGNRSDFAYSSPDFGKLYIDYVQTNHKTYVQIYSKNSHQKNQRNAKKKHYELAIHNQTYLDNAHQYDFCYHSHHRNFSSNSTKNACESHLHKSNQLQPQMTNHLKSINCNSNFSQLERIINKGNMDYFREFRIDDNRNKENSIKYSLDNNSYSERNRIIKPQANTLMHSNDLFLNVNCKLNEKKGLIYSQPNNHPQHNVSANYTPYYNNIEDDPYWNINQNEYKQSNSNKKIIASNANDDYRNKQNLSTTKFKHKLLNFNQFQAIFNENENTIDSNAIKTNKSNCSKEYPKSPLLKTVSSPGMQSDALSPQVNGTKCNQEQSTISANVLSEQQPRQLSSQFHQEHNGESYILPFYLLSKRELMENVVNYLFEKPKKMNVIYYPKREKKQQGAEVLKNNYK